MILNKKQDALMKTADEEFLLRCATGIFFAVQKKYFIFVSTKLSNKII
jgi:hypothetical protein